MKTIAVGKFKQTCLGLLEEVRQTGRPVLITKRGLPLVQVVPVRPPAGRTRWMGLLRGTGAIRGDIVGAAALPEEWEALRE